MYISEPLIILCLFLNLILWCVCVCVCVCVCWCVCVCVCCVFVCGVCSSTNSQILPQVVKLPTLNTSRALWHSSWAWTSIVLCFFLCTPPTSPLILSLLTGSGWARSALPSLWHRALRSACRSPPMLACHAYKGWTLMTRINQQ